MNLLLVIHNTLMLAEMVLLQYIARELYKKLLPFQPKNNFVSQISTIGGIMSTEYGTIENNNRTCENLNLTIDLTDSKKGHLNVALDIKE